MKPWGWSCINSVVLAELEKMAENFTRFVEKKNQKFFFYEFLKAFKFAATLAHPSPSMKIRIVPPVSFSTELRWWTAGRKKSCRIKSFKNPLVHDLKFKKNAKFHALFKLLNTNSYGVRALIFGNIIYRRKYYIHLLDKTGWICLTRGKSQRENVN